MKDPEITVAKNNLEILRTISRELNHSDENSRKVYQTARNTYKKSIQPKKATFLRKALSSKNPKEVWKTVQQILNPPKNA